MAAMSDGTPAAVTYVGLPISSGGGHGLGRMALRTAYDRTIAFLRSCTEQAEPLRYSLSLMDYLGRAAPSVDGLETELRRRFGDDAAIPAARVAEALNFMESIHPQATDQAGLATVWFWVHSRFRILDPATGRPFAGQDPERYGRVEYEYGAALGTSGLRLMLHNRATIGIELCIPDADEERLRQVVPWLQRHLPFKLSSKHWKEWTPTRSGSFKGRKRPAPPGVA